MILTLDLVRVHRGDVCKGGDGFGVAEHFLTECTGKLWGGDCDVEGELWCNGWGCWQAYLFILLHGESPAWGWCSTNRYLFT